MTSNALNQALVGVVVINRTEAATSIHLTQAEPYNPSDDGESGQGSLSQERPHHKDGRNGSSVIDSDEDSSTQPSEASSFNVDAHEEDTGISSSIATSSITAQHRVEGVFFCRFLVGLSRIIIAEFVDKRKFSGHP